MSERLQDRRKRHERLFGPCPDYAERRLAGEIRVAVRLLRRVSTSAAAELSLAAEHWREASP